MYSYLVKNNNLLKEVQLENMKFAQEVQNFENDENAKAILN